MLKYFVGLIGLACLAASPALAGSPACGESCCSPSCGESCCKESCNRCPHCGCKLVPVCHCCCEMKKETKYHYCEICKTICVPGPGCCLFGKSCECGCENGCCEKGCCEKGCCEKGCESCCEKGCETCNKHNSGCGCSVHCVKKLVKCPYTVEHPVRTCTVEWCCPHCSGCGCQGGQCCEGACTSSGTPVTAPMAPAMGAPSMAPAAPAAPKPAPTKSTMDRGLFQSLFSQN